MGRTNGVNENTLLSGLLKALAHTLQNILNRGEMIRVSLHTEISDIVGDLRSNEEQAYRLDDNIRGGSASHERNGIVK